MDGRTKRTRCIWCKGQAFTRVDSESAVTQDPLKDAKAQRRTVNMLSLLGEAITEAVMYEAPG